MKISGYIKYILYIKGTVFEQIKWSGTESSRRLLKLNKDVKFPAMRFSTFQSLNTWTFGMDILRLVVLKTKASVVAQWTQVFYFFIFRPPSPPLKFCSHLFFFLSSKNSNTVCVCVCVCIRMFASFFRWQKLPRCARMVKKNNNNIAMK